MIVKVNEPTANYSVTEWKNRRYDARHPGLSFDIVNGEGLYRTPSIRSVKVNIVKPRKTKKVKLSSLIGKMSKERGKELLKKTAELRKEWERDI